MIWCAGPDRHPFAVPAETRSRSTIRDVLRQEWAPCLFRQCNHAYHCGLSFDSREHDGTLLPRLPCQPVGRSLIVSKQILWYSAIGGNNEDAPRVGVLHRSCTEPRDPFPVWRPAWSFQLALCRDKECRFITISRDSVKLDSHVGVIHRWGLGSRKDECCSVGRPIEIVNGQGRFGNLFTRRCLDVNNMQPPVFLIPVGDSPILTILFRPYLIFRFRVGHCVGNLVSIW